jgi:hypothetical protein
MENESMTSYQPNAGLGANTQKNNKCTFSQPAEQNSNGV